MKVMVQIHVQEKHMSIDETSVTHAAEQSIQAPPAVPLTELVLEVYESAPPLVQNRMLTRLVGRVYETAPPAARSLLLEKLLQPMGVLALVTVANGIFAKIRLRSDWPQFQVRVEDAQKVRASDVVALADYLLQASSEAINGLSEVISASPLLASSAAATVLMMALLRRNHARRATDSE
jgi:hypothetical protein